MKIFIIALVIFSSPALSGEMVLTENYSITVNLADSTVPDNSFTPKPTPEFNYVDPNRWTTTNTALEVAFQVLNIIDWGQTRYIAEHPDKFQEAEGGIGYGGSAQYIGKHPTTKGVDVYMAETAVIHFVVAYFLPRNWRDMYQYITIGQKLDATISNVSAGVKVSF